MRQQVLVNKVRARLRKKEGVVIKASVAEINVILTKIIDLDVKERRIWVAKLGSSPGERALCWNGRDAERKDTNLEPERDGEEKADNNANKIPTGHEEESLKTTTVETSKAGVSKEPFKRKTVKGSKL